MWKYDPGAGRRKHKWTEPRADIVDDPESGAPVGKCPSTLTQEDAERLLNGGIPYSPPGWDKSWPKQIFNVHEQDGVVYVARPTLGGVSYHGYPANPRKRDVPPDVAALLRRRAAELGCMEEFDTWMRR